MSRKTDGTIIPIIVGPRRVQPTEATAKKYASTKSTTRKFYKCGDSYYTGHKVCGFLYPNHRRCCRQLSTSLKCRDHVGRIQFAETETEAFSKSIISQTRMSRNPVYMKVANNKFPDAIFLVVMHKICMVCGAFKCACNKKHIS